MKARSRLKHLISSAFESEFVFKDQWRVVEMAPATRLLPFSSHVLSKSSELLRTGHRLGHHCAAIPWLFGAAGVVEATARQRLNLLSPHPVCLAARSLDDLGHDGLLSERMQWRRSSVDGRLDLSSVAVQRSAI